MLRQKCSYRNDIETLRKPKSKEKKEIKVCKSLVTC